MSIEIIAELAQGFEGRPEQARLLMKAATTAGADAVKYQLVYADELATPDYKYYELFRSLEMADEVWVELAEYARELGVRLHLDVFGTSSLQLAERLEVAAVKIHGTDLTNIGLLSDVARSSVPRVLLGAGGGHANEIRQAINILADKQIVVLLGFQGYPTPDESNQIARTRLVIKSLGDTHQNVVVGFADHARPESPLRYALAATAIGAGATVFEKHLTLGKVMKLEDHESALNPDEFLEFSQIIRHCSDALGEAKDTEDFGMSEVEKGYRKMIRRHVVTSRDLKKGSIIAPTDIVLKRSSAENVLTDLDLAYDKTLNCDLKKNMPIATNDII
ncbi:MAG TPA: NeuB family protein [Desulfobulbaceae bacterium]|nr:MAG: NeuB family protein [Deltaproteobacteria bacterium RIFOXYD12_FULL_53_23]HCC54606.1 NeuB family protein [Desulfobulbaceae bacterium]